MHRGVAAVIVLLAVLASIAGLAIGSFLNVVIHRVPRGESVVAPRSRCPHCQTPIAPRHNVPVLSWLLLRGKCAHCRGPISVRYPLVELATAALFAGITLRFGATPALPAYLYLAAISVALALIDLDVKRLPDAIVKPSYLVGIVLLVPAVLAGGDWRGGLRALAAMAVLWAFYLVLWLIYPAGMGWGDIKLAGVLGLYLGWLGWGSLLVGAFAAFLLGGVMSTVLLVARRAGRKSMIPFGPFMLAGALVAVFAAAPLSHWYVALLTPTV
ncbi:MAG: prepilin peptidase [Actinomycetia bacterium]|nr:prepilin peptidase [Actinomycetes bacterium]MDQ1659582.1 leader peptidase (prepilin peptidase) / N-methyltransferase [Cryptosporangiaceae bacterium]